jgi:hypothetical protein
MRIPAALLTLSLVAPASAFELSFPVDCELGNSCFIQQYVDRDSGPEARDFACGGLSYDGHKGTDIALPTRADLKRDVPVLAAAPGRVVGTRNSMDDVLYNEDTAADVEGRECGNGVVLAHENGYETQYCHLKKGSVRVRKGDDVAAGDVLGAIGLSGKTQFPHVHLSVRKDGNVVDPFDTGDLNTCQSEAPNLWAEDIDYVPGAVVHAGFAAGVPDYESVKAGSAGKETLSPTSSGLVLFGLAFGGQAGDKMRLAITGPEGKIFDQAAILTRAQAQFFRAGGKRLTQDAWPAGTYVGEVQLVREGDVLNARKVTVDIK